MIKEEYKELRFELIKFDSSDVIITSTKDDDHEEGYIT